MTSKSSLARVAHLAVLLAVFGIPLWTVGLVPILRWFGVEFGVWAPVAFGGACLFWAELAGGPATRLADAMARSIAPEAKNGHIP